MNTTDETSGKVLATIAPGPGRLWLAVLMLGVLCFLLLSLTLQMPAGALGWQAVLVLSAAASGWAAVRMVQSAGTRIEMTPDEIRDSEGRILARIEEIAKIERGALAFKPSNGFMLRLKTSAPRAWVPGLWWRIGRSVGVGGVTPAHQSKTMAELIAMRLEGRDL